MVKNTTSGLRKIIIRASCQCSQKSTMIMPVINNTATINLLTVSAINLSIVSISTTKCELIEPLPSVSYSDMEILLTRCNKSLRILYVISLAIMVNARVCRTNKAKPEKRNIKVSTVNSTIYKVGFCHSLGIKPSTIANKAPGLSSRTSSTSMGIIKGMGTMSRVANRARILAIISAFLCSKTKLFRDSSV